MTTAELPLFRRDAYARLALAVCGESVPTGLQCVVLAAWLEAMAVAQGDSRLARLHIDQALGLIEKTHRAAEYVVGK